jgi:putative ABC transport system permease protein
LGASVPNIVSNLMLEFLKLMIIANIIAWPVAYIAMRHWLQNFPYRIEINIGVFILAGLFAFTIAALTVFYQAIKASMANPVDSLRYEC